MSKTVGKFQKEKYYDDEGDSYNGYTENKKRKIEDIEIRKQMRKKDYRKLRMDDLDDKYY